MKVECFLLAVVLNGMGSVVAEPTGCPEIVVEAPRAHAGVVVKAVDFGFSVDSDKNATALNRALEECRRVKASRLELAPGTYRCFDEPGLVVRDFADFTVDGKGAVLVFRRPAEYRGQPQSELILDKGNLLVQRCVRTQVGNFTMDWDWENDPLGAFVRIKDRHVDVEHGENSYVDFLFVDYERHPKYPQAVPIQKMMAMDESRVRFRKGSGFSFGQTEGHFGPKNEWVAPNVLRVWPYIPMPGKNQNPMTRYAYSPVMNRKTVERFETNGLYRLQHYYYGKNGINLDSNVHLTVRDVTVWSCFGMGMVTDGTQHHWQVENFRVVPPTEAEIAAAYPGRRFFHRPVTSVSDGHHVARSRGDCKYVNCRWTLNNDDSSNFHDRFTIAVRASDKVLDVINRRGAEYFRAQPGTMLELRYPNFAPTGFKTKLLRVVGNRLHVDKVLPQQKGQCFLVWDRSYGTDRVMMKDCVFEDTGWRNIFSPSDLTLDGCVFRRTSGVPLRFIADYRSDLWCEGMGATNLVVRNCRFEDTCLLNPKDSCISTVCVTPTDWDVGPVDKGFVGGGLLIEKCKFINPGGYILDLGCGKNVIYRDNEVVLGLRAKENPNAGKFNVSGAENVQILLPGETRYLDAFDLSGATCGLNKRPQTNRSLFGNKLRLGGETYAHGVGTHAESVMFFRANGKVKAFDAIVGIDQEAQEYPESWCTRKNWGCASFRVYADGKKVADSGILKERDKPVKLHADLLGAKSIVLECTDGGHWAGYMMAHGDWADAKFTLEPGATIVADSTRNAKEQLGILTPAVSDLPKINGADRWGVRPGHPIIYRIPVSGEKPIRLTVTGLPDGATFDAEKGILGGAVATAGDYPLTVTATNAKGTVSCVFHLIVGEKIALTPPMGWNSWNIWGSSVSDEKVRAAAKAGRVYHDDASDIWARPMANGDWVFGAVNRYPFARGIYVRWSFAGLGDGTFHVRDLWRQRDLGEFKEGYSALVPAHATTVIRVRKPL